MYIIYFVQIKKHEITENIFAHGAWWTNGKSADKRYRNFLNICFYCFNCKKFDNVFPNLKSMFDLNTYNVEKRKCEKLQYCVEK